ncbi:MAG: hypothetical protein IGR93_21260 [Hydrococcus sp. C42_A2020_068]|nr:hypothetical protein [Hydrococcus sp. C42_A2020_068]
MSWLGRHRYLLPLLVAIVLTVYFIGLRSLLAPTTTATVELAALGILVLALAVVVLALVGTLLITLIVAAWTRSRVRVMPWLLRLRGEMTVVLALILILAVIVMASQWLA